MSKFILPERQFGGLHPRSLRNGTSIVARTLNRRSTTCPCSARSALLAGFAHWRIAYLPVLHRPECTSCWASPPRSAHQAGRSPNTWRLRCNTHLRSRFNVMDGWCLGGGVRFWKYRSAIFRLLPGSSQRADQVREVQPVAPAVIADAFYNA